MTPKMQQRLAMGVVAVGLALLAMMVTTEGEPGALPLALILAGGLGIAGARWRERRDTPPPRG